MHGFSVVISLSNATQSVDFHWKPLFDFQTDYIKRNCCIDNVQIEQYTSIKFSTEKLWINHDQFFIVTEGLITNIDILCKKYKVDNYTDLITLLYDNSTPFFEEFTGNFTGFIYNKKSKTATTFNNHTGTKKLFIYHDENYILLSTDLFTLSKTLDQLDINKTLDTEAAYLLLTSGFMHEDFTLIKEVKQITAGEYALISTKGVTIKSYFHLKDILENTDSENEIITKLDKLFNESIRLEFEFDEKHKFTSLTTLSGGLDSRMVALMAHEQDYRKQELFNFSECAYAEEIIATKIARKYQLKMHQIPLTPKGLLAIDDVVAVNDGLTLYSGAGHAFEAISKLNSEKFGIIHTGMIGDAVLGSFLSVKYEKVAIPEDGLYSYGLFAKAKKTLERSISNHRNEELYKFYNRAFLGANNGFLFFDLIGESQSAFLYPKFIAYAHSIPKKFNYKERLYIQWIMKMHPEYANFIWEAIGGKPTNNSFIRQLYRYKRAIIRRLPVQSMWKNTMNPEQLWYDENPEVKHYLDNYFNVNINKLAFNKELMQDTALLYNTGNITEKTQVLTLLGAYKLLFE